MSALGRLALLSLLMALILNLLAILSSSCISMVSTPSLLLRFVLSVLVLRFDLFLDFLLWTVQSLKYILGWSLEYIMAEQALLSYNIPLKCTSSDSFVQLKLVNLNNYFCSKVVWLLSQEFRKFILRQNDFWPAAAEVANIYLWGTKWGHGCDVLVSGDSVNCTWSCKVVIHIILERIHDLWECWLLVLFLSGQHSRKHLRIRTLIKIIISFLIKSSN